MTSTQWDAHKLNRCASCVVKRCPIKPIMDKDPEDQQCKVFFRKSTPNQTYPNCNQYRYV